MNSPQPLLLSLLAPGIWLVQRFKFTGKFLLVFMLLLMPLVYASYYLLDDVHQHSREKHLEMEGLQYAVRMSALLELVAQHRGLRNGLLHGDERFRARIAGMQPALERALAEASAADQRWGAGLRLSGQWQQIRARWLKLHGDAGQLNAEASWQQHTALIDGYLDFIYRIAINGNLYTENDPATRHLIEVNFHYLPELVEALGKLRGSGSGMIADGRITMEEYHEFTGLISAVTAAIREVRRSMGFAFEHDRQLRADFAELADRTISQAEGYVALAQTQSWQPAALSVSAPLYFDLGTEAISSGYHLLKMTTERNRINLEQNIAHLKGHRNELLASFVLGMLLFGYVVMAFFYSLRNTTRSLEDAVEHLQRGEAPQEVVLPGRDELGNIARLFNRLSGQLIRTNNQLRRRHSEDQLLQDISLRALQNDNLDRFVQAALQLVTAAACWLSCKPAGQINLARGDKIFYVAAVSGMEPVAPAAVPRMPEMRIERVMDSHILCLPFVVAGEYVGELILPVESETLPPEEQAFLPRLADALAVAVGRLSAEAALLKREADLLRSNEELERFAYGSADLIGITPHILTAAAFWCSKCGIAACFIVFMAIIALNSIFQGATWLSAHNNHRRASIKLAKPNNVNNCTVFLAKPL